MTSGRSGLSLLQPDGGRFRSWCGSCAEARKSVGGCDLPERACIERNVAIQAPANRRYQKHRGGSYRASHTNTNDTKSTAADIKPIEKEGIIMSKQTFVITPKNYSRPLEVLGEHAAVLASGEVGSELFLKQGSRGSTSSRYRRPSESVPTKTFSKAIHRLKEDVSSWYELHRRNGATNVVVWAIYLELLLMLVLLVLLPFDTVQVGGRYRLIKPLNFAMSMAMYLATVVILLDYLRASMWWKKVIGWGVSICILTAITCITMQAARGTTSHFNNSTPFDSAVSSLMDIVDPLNGVFVLVLLIFAIQVRYDVSRSSQLGIAFGIFLFLAGSAIGGVMVAQGQSVMGVAPGGPALPVLNWSTMGGDFRVAHFLGIHALQILPIAGWLIDRLKGLPRRAKPTAVVAVSAGYVLLMGFVFMQAMNGVPLVRM
jgi:hypothetical protein